MKHFIPSTSVSRSLSRFAASHSKRHFSVDLGGTAIALLTAANSIVALINLYQGYKRSFHGKVNKVVSSLNKEKDYPPGVAPLDLGLENVNFIQREQPEIEALFQQNYPHFSFLHGNSKSGKTTYITKLVEDTSRVLFFQFRSGDATDVVVKRGIGLPTSDKTVNELLLILDAALLKIKKTNELTEFPTIPLIIVEDLLSIEDESERIYFARKMQQFHEQKKCSVMYIANNLFTYNFLTRDPPFPGTKERLRLFRISKVDADEIERELSDSLSLNLTDEQVQKVLKFTGSNFGDIMSILNFYNQDFNLAKAIENHINMYEDNMKTLFEDCEEEEVYIKFNIFDEIVQKGVVRKSYDLCWDCVELYPIYERVIKDLMRRNFLKRQYPDRRFISFYRPILTYVYQQLLMENIEIEQRRNHYEKWLIENEFEK